MTQLKITVYVVCAIIFATIECRYIPRRQVIPQRMERFFPFNRHAVNAVNHVGNSADHVVTSARHAVNAANHAVNSAKYALNLVEQNVYNRGRHLKTHHMRSPVAAVARVQKLRPLPPNTGQKQSSFRAIINKSVRNVDATNRIRSLNSKSYKLNTYNTRRVPRRNNSINVKLNQLSGAPSQRTLSIKTSNVRNLRVTHSRSGTDISINKPGGKTNIRISRTHSDESYSREKNRGKSSPRGITNHVAHISHSASVDPLSGQAAKFLNHWTDVMDHVHKTYSGTKINSQHSVHSKHPGIPSQHQDVQVDAAVLPAGSWNMTNVTNITHSTKVASADRKSTIAASKFSRSDQKIVDGFATFEGVPQGGLSGPDIVTGTFSISHHDVGIGSLIPHIHPVVHVASISTLGPAVTRQRTSHMPSLIPNTSLVRSVLSGQPTSHRLSLIPNTSLVRSAVSGQPTSHILSLIPKTSLVKSAVSGQPTSHRLSLTSKTSLVRSAVSGQRTSHIHSVVTVPDLSAATPIPAMEVGAEDIDVIDVPDTSDVTNVYNVSD